MKSITVRVDMDEIKEALFELDNEELLTLIKEIDEAVQEWGFTKSLHEYFTEQMKEYPEEE